MPIGIPTVYIESPGDVGDGDEEAEIDAEWTDIYTALYNNRMLFLCQLLDEELSNQLVALMIFLSLENVDDRLSLYINSPGGSVTCGISVHDAMGFVPGGVSTNCFGTAASMATFILASGDPGERFALPNARIMIHQPEGGNLGQAKDVLSEAIQLVLLRRQVARLYSKITTQKLEQIAYDMNRDEFMSATEAKEYGLVDEISTDFNQISSFPPIDDDINDDNSENDLATNYLKYAQYFNNDTSDGLNNEQS